MTYESDVLGLLSGLASAFAGAFSAAPLPSDDVPGSDSFDAFLSITFLVGIVIGGLASVPGAIFGALFIQFVPNYAQEISKAAPWAIYGIFLIAFMYVMPDGVAGFLRRLYRRLSGQARPVQPAASVAPKGGQHAQV